MQKYCVRFFCEGKVSIFHNLRANKMAVFEHSIEKKNLQSFSSQLKPIAKIEQKLSGNK